MSWETLERAFLRHREGQDLAPSTLWLQRRWLADFFSFCQEEQIDRPEELSPEHVRSYQRRLLWQPSRRGGLLAPNSLHHCLCGVRTFLRWAYREGLLALDPTLDLVLGRPPQPPRRLLSAAELERVRRVIDRDAASGLLVAALFELLQQVSLPELLSRDIEHAEPRGLRLADGRRLVLEERAAGALAAYLERGRPELLARGSGDPALFLSARGGRRLRPEAVGERLRVLGRVAGLEVSLGPRRLLQSAQALEDEFLRPRLPFGELQASSARASNSGSKPRKGAPS